MFAFDDSRSRRETRGRARPVPAIVENLERRDLMAYTPLGYSIADLTVSGFAAPVAAYGSQIAVTVDVQNLGASSILEPLALAPGATSEADAPASTVTVYLSSHSRFGPGAVPIGTVSIPATAQNSVSRVNALLDMPTQRIPGLPANGKTAYVFFKLDQNREVRDLNRANNFTRVGAPVQIAAPLPDLFAIALDTPNVMQPGDLIRPEIKIANFGTADPALQGPFTVVLVASTDKNFGPGDTPLATFTIPSLTPLSSVASRDPLLGDVNINDPANVLTLISPVVQLPTAPANYYIGVIVDPLNQISELSELGVGASSALDPIRPVGPPIAGLPPAAQTSATAPPGNQFPIPPFGPFSLLTNPIAAADTGGTSSTGTPTGTVGSVFLQSLTRRLNNGGGLASKYRGPATSPAQQ